MQDRRQSKGLDKPARFRVRQSRSKSLPPTLHSTTVVRPLPLGLIESRLKTSPQECVGRIRGRQKEIELATKGQRGESRATARRCSRFTFSPGIRESRRALASDTGWSALDLRARAGSRVTGCFGVLHALGSKKVMPFLVARMTPVRRRDLA